MTDVNVEKLMQNADKFEEQMKLFHAEFLSSVENYHKFNEILQSFKPGDGLGQIVALMATQMPKNIFLFENIFSMTVSNFGMIKETLELLRKTNEVNF